MRFKLGLTGSIGMGKSTTAQMFQDSGCVLWDADAAVHRIYGPNGAAVEGIGRIFPEAIENGSVSRHVLRRIIAANPDALAQIESLVHPLVQQDREAFIASHPEAIGIFDIPLLFETGAEKQMNAVVCVTVPRETQIERVLARGTMTYDDLTRILDRQMPNDEKCALADYVINTESLDQARTQVQDVMADIQRTLSHA